VVFRVHEERKTRQQMDMFVAPPPTPPAPRPGTTAAAADPRLPSPDSRVGNALNPRYTFDHFVIGKSNDVAAAAAQGAAQAPGKVYNPLFIYGDTGLGKTHLMLAVAHVLLGRNPRTRVTYVGTEQFTNEFIGALQGRTTAEFRRRYRETDLLLVDDVQFLKGKESTQEEFFHTFNAIYEAGRQICLTSDRPPKEIPGLEARLVSRFEWGMVAHVDLPEFEHRVAILRKKAELDHLELTIPDDGARVHRPHVKSSVRELEGSIIKLRLRLAQAPRGLGRDAREALRDKLRRGARRRVTARHGAGPRWTPSSSVPRSGGSPPTACMSKDAHQDAHRAAPGGDVAHPRAARHPARRDRQRLRRARPLTVIHSIERAASDDGRGRRFRGVWRSSGGVGKPRP
jgi:chromosomal replication initiator protein